MNVETLVGKALLTSDPDERAWIEDQITINLYARRLLCGNSRVIVIDGGDQGISGYNVADFRDGITDELRETVARHGWRIIEGSVLFTPRDNPRKYAR